MDLFKFNLARWKRSAAGAVARFPTCSLSTGQIRRLISKLAISDVRTLPVSLAAFAAAESLEKRVLFTWIGATTGSTNDTSHNYNNTANWVSGVIDDSFSGVTFTGNTTLYLSASRTTGASGLNLGYTGAANLTFLSSSTTTQTLTLAGPVSSGVANRTATIGDTANTSSVSIVLSNATCTMNTAPGESLVLANLVSGAQPLTVVGSGSVLLWGTNTYSGGTNLSSGTLDINSVKAIGTGALTINGGTIDNTSGASITNTNNNLQTWNASYTFAGTNALNLGTGAITLGANVTISNSASTLTVAGIISAAHSLTEAGPGTLVLSGANTFTGGLTLSAGTLNINNAKSLGTGIFTISGGTIDNTSGASITETNNNLQSWLANFNFTGSSPLNLGSGAVTLATNVTITNSASTLIDAGIISGAFSLTESGPGALILSGANTFTGGVTLSAGTLGINNAKALGTGALTINGGTIDNTSGAAVTESNANTQNWNSNFAFNGSNALNLGTGAVTLGGNITITNNASTLSIGGIISGAGDGITKIGAGALLLSGANTYTGGVTLSTGTLDINNAKALGTGALTISGGTIDNTSGSTIVLTNNNAQTWAANFTFTGTAALNLGTGAITLATSPTVTTTASILTVAGIVSGAQSIAKAGAGALVLSGANMYSNGTTLSAGLLDINNASAIGTGTLTINGGTIDNNSGAAVMLSNNNAITLGGNFIFTGTGALNLGTGAVTLAASPTITTNASILTVGGIVSGAQSIAKAGAGALVLSGANTYSNGTTLSAGILDINNTTAIGAGTLTINAGTIDNNSGSALTLSNNNAITLGASFTFTGTGALNLGSGAVMLTGNPTITTTASTLTIGGIISGAKTLTKAGNGTLTLSGANTFSAGMNLSAGILAINNAAAIGTGTFTILGGTIDNTSGSLITLANNNPLTWTASFVFTGSNALNLGAGAVTLTNNVTVTATANTLSVGGAISGAKTLTKAGAGALALSGANTYSAANLSTGTLAINSPAAIGAGTFTILGGTIDNTSGAAITLANNNTMVWAASFAFTGTNALNLGTGAVTLTGSPTVTTTANLLSVGGIISGAKALTKAGAGTLLLSGANTYSAGTTLSAGTLDINSPAAIGTSTFTVAGGTIDNTSGAPITLSNNNAQNWSGNFTFTGTNNLNLGTGAVAPSANRILTLSGGVLTVGGVISGIRSLTEAGTGTLVLSGVNTYTGGTLLSSGTLNLNNAKAIGTGAFTISGGTIDNTSGSAITLTNNNAETWNAGFTFTGTNSLSLGTGAVTLGANITVTNLASTLSVAGIVSGAKSLTETGPGTLLLSGVNTFTGGLTLSAGTLDLNNAKAPGTGTFKINGGTIDNTTAGAITLSNNNAQNWGGDFAFAGTQSLNLGTGGITLGGNLTLTTTANTLTLGGIISGAQSLTTAGPGTLTVTGASTYSGGLTINAGTFYLNNASGSGTGTGPVTVNSSAMLAGTGTATGSVTVNAGATLSPGVGGPAILNTGNLSLASGSTLSVILNGNTAGTGYSQVNVTGTVTVNGSTLNISGTRSAHDSSLLYLIANDAADTITGTFNALGEGATTALNNVTYSATYAGGSGNDFGFFANPAAAAVAVLSATNPSAYNSAVTFTAAVSSIASGTPTGTVTFMDGATTLGTGTLNASGGTTLVFSSLSVGSHSITAVYGGDTNFSGASSSIVTQTVTAAAAAKLVFIQQPTDVVAGVADSPAITVDVQDAYGNLCTTNNSSVTLAVGSGPGTTSGTVTVAAVNGLATFSNILLNLAGSVTLVAHDGALTAGTSSSFDVTHASAAQVGFTQQPSNVAAFNTISPAVTVSVEDAFGNVVTDDNSTITVALASGPGSLNGTLTQPAINGVASFSDLWLSLTGSYTLSATDGSLSSNASHGFTVGIAVSSQVVFNVEPVSVTAGAQVNPSVVVYIEDQYGNIATNDNSIVTLSLASGPGPLAGTLLVSAVNGIATFNNVRLSTAGNDTLTASDGSLTSDTTSTFNVSPAAASQLLYIQQPTNLTAGNTISPSVVIDVEDAFGNVVATDNSNVTLSVATGPRAVGGTATVTAVNGIATFSNVELDTADNYTLVAGDGSLTTAASNSFTVIPASASKLIYNVRPSNVAAGIANNPAIIVDVTDAFGNAITTDHSTITLTVATGPGSLSGTLSTAAINGVATFGNVIINTSGAYTLAASDGSLSSVTSSSFTVSAAAAAQVVYLQQPGNVTAGVAQTPAVTLKIEDVFGNLSTADTSNVTLSAASGPGAVSGTVTMAAIGGVATFSNLILTTAGTYTLTASDGGLTSAISSSFTASHAAASAVAFLQQPTNVQPGNSISPAVTVSLQDAFGNIATNDNSNVTLFLGSGPGSLSGSLTVAAVNGVATFNDLSLSTSGSYTLEASDGSLAVDASQGFTVGATVTSALAFNAQPANVVAGVAIGPAVVVYVEDQYSNLVTTDNSSVTISIASGPGILGGTCTTLAMNGVATFSNLLFNTAGTYTLTAGDAGLISATSSSFTVTSAAASQLVYTRQPTNVTAGIAISPSILLNVEDAFGNLVTTDNSTVTLAVSTGPGAITGTIIVTAASGVATFTNAILNTAGDYRLSAGDGALSMATSNSFTVTPTAAMKLVYATQPSNAIAGVANNPAIVLYVEDQFGNVAVANNSSVTLSVGSGPGSTSGTVTTAAVNGTATFTNVRLNNAGAYTLTASDSSLTAATSGSFTIVAAAPAKLIDGQQPGNVTAGVTQIPALTVLVEDAFGNVVTTDHSNITLSIATGLGSIGGTATVAAINGLATFSNIFFNTASTYTLAATDAGLTAATSDSFVVTAAAAAKVVFGVGPGDATAGVANNPAILVDIEDQFGNLVTTESSAVTLAIATGPGSAAGTVTANAISGIATFNNLLINTSGAYTLGASDGSLTTAISSSFTVSAAAAAQLIYGVQPGTVIAGVAQSPGIIVNVEDQYGNIVTTDNSSLTMAVATGPGSAGGTLTTTANNGGATFSNLTFNTAGTYIITATDGSLASATSNIFTVNPAAASQLVYVQQPGNTAAGTAISPAIVLQVQDPFGNLVTSDFSNVTLVTATGVGSARGTLTVAATSGIATFNNIIFSTAGAHTLSASDGSLVPATSSSFTVTAAAASQLVFGLQPHSVIAGAASSPSIAVEIEDQFGNLAATDHSNVTLTVQSGPGSITGTVTIAAVNGIATFGNILLNTAGNYTLAASDGSLNAASSNSFTVAPAAASQLVFDQQPGNVVAGSAISPSVPVDIEDAYGNIVINDNSSVTLSIGSGPGALSGTFTATAVNGVASFSNLVLQAAGTYTLIAGDGSLTSATSGSFSVTPAAASQLVYAQQPTSTIAGNTVSSPIVVDVQDAFGNLVTSDTSNVTLRVASGPGSAGGTLVVAAVNGVAIFSNVFLRTAGNYTVVVSDSTLASMTSSGFTVGPDAASQLLFRVQPGNVMAGEAVSLPLVVQVEDSFGNLVVTDNSNVTLSVATGPGGAGGTVTVNAVNGIASFNNVVINTAGDYTLTANCAGLTAATSNSFSVSAAAAARLVYLQQPGNVTAGVAQRPAIVLDVQDAFGNLVATDNSNVTLSVASGFGTAVATLTAAASNGVVTFNNLVLNTAGSFTLTAGDGGLITATSSSFTVVAAAASQMLFAAQPSNATAGVANNPPIVVNVEDQFGNLVATDSSTVTLSVSSGPGIASGTLGTAAIGGVATFTDIVFTTAGSYTLNATEWGLSGALSGGFVVSAAGASQLAYAVQPTDVAAGVNESSIILDVEDAFGNLVATDHSTVALSAAWGPGGAIGTLTATASNGVATFSNVTFNIAGTYALTASDGSLSPAESSNFAVTPAAAFQLVYVQQPTDMLAGTTISPSVAVSVEDAFGNRVTGDSSNVTLTVASGPGLTTGTLTVAAVNGVATFPAVTLQTSGSYTLAANDGSLHSATSSVFSVVAAAASQLIYSVQPSNATAGVADNPSIVVDLEDPFGNLATTDNSSVTLTVGSGSGSIGGTQAVTASHGIATFSNVVLNTAGNATLVASDGSLTAATSNSFVVTPANASQLIFFVQPSDATAGVANSAAIAVDVLDSFGNLCTADSSVVTLSVATGLGDINGAVAATVINGTAIFGDLIINTAGNYTLTAGDGSLSSATSTSFAVSHAAAAQVHFLHQPSNVQPGDAISPAVTVTVEDAFGNRVEDDNSNMSIALTSGPGGLAGTLSVAVVNGVATFSDLSLTTAGSYRLLATDGNLTPELSQQFTVGTAIRSLLSLSVQAANVTAGVAINPSVVVQVEDQYGNLITTDSASVTLSVASGPGSMGGTLTVQVVNGIARFSNLLLTSVGTYTLSATDGSLTSAPSTPFMVHAAASSQLRYSQQPGDSTAGSVFSPSIAVDVEDSFGNLVDTDNSNVTITVASGPGGLGGTVTAAAINGVATFSHLVLNTAGNYTLAASDGGLAAVTSDNFTVSPAAASQLVYAVQPSPLIAGVANASSIVLDVEDAFGNMVTTDSSSLTLSIASGPGPASGVLTVPVINGVASFNNFILYTAGNYTLIASDGALVSAPSISFQVSAAAAAQLFYAQQPVDGIAGNTIAPGIVVAVEDAFGNVVVSDNSTVSLNAGGQLGVITAAVVNGVATFGSLVLNTAGDYSVTASDGSLTPITSNHFAVSPAAAAQLLYVQQPVDTAAGAVLSSIVLEIEDAFGNLCGSDNANVTLADSSGNVSLIGAVQTAAVNGIVTFNDVWLNTAGDYTLTASQGGLVSAPSTRFTVSPLTAAQLVCTVQPGDVIAGDANMMLVQVQDVLGNLVITDSSSVTLSIASGPGSLGGTVTVAAVNGVATFSNFNLYTAGDYRLTASDGSLAAATLNTFAVAPTAASQLVFIQQPGTIKAGLPINPAIVVAVEDRYGNILKADNSVITLSVASGSGILGGTLSAAAVNGVVTFDNIVCNTAGTYALGVNDAAGNAAISNLFSATAAHTGIFQVSTPTGKIPASVLTGAKQSGVSVTINNTGPSITGTVTINLYASNSPAVDGSSILLGQITMPAKKFKSNKRTAIRLPAFAFPTISGAYYLVADVMLNRAVNSNDAATALPIQVSAPFVDASAISFTTSGKLVSGKSFTVTLTIENLGNVLLNQTITLNAFISGDAQKIASTPLLLKLLPGQTRKVKVKFVPQTIPAGADLNSLTITMNVPGDVSPLNNTFMSLGHPHRRAR